MTHTSPKKNAHRPKHSQGSGKTRLHQGVAFLVITFFKDQIRVVFFNVLRGVVGAASFPEISRVLSAKILKFFWGRWLAPAGWVSVVVLLLFVCFLVPLHGLSGRAGLGWLGWLLAGLAGFAPGWVGWVGCWLGWLGWPGWPGWLAPGSWLGWLGWLLSHF